MINIFLKIGSYWGSTVAHVMAYLMDWADHIVVMH